MQARSKLLWSAFALAFSLAVPAQSRDAEPQRASIDSPAAAWGKFQQETSGHWLAQWHAATGTPRTVYGDGFPLDDWRESSLAEARRHAQRVLQRWPDLLGLGTAEFRECIGARMGRTWTFTFEQWFAGLQVIGGRVDVRIHMNGRLCFLGSTAWPIPAAFDTMPKIDETTAVAAAWLWLGREPGATRQPGRPRSNRLVIWGDAEAPALAPFALAWEIPISAVDAAGQGPIGRVYVDAHTGAFLHYANDKHECGFAGCAAARPVKAPLPATYTVMAWTHTLYSPVSAPTNTPLAGVEVFVPGVGLVVTDQNGQFTADLTAPTQVSIALNGVHSSLVQGPSPVQLQATLQPGVNATLQLGSAAATEQQLAHSTTYYWIDRVNAWARSILGNSPQLAIADNVVPTVNIAQTCNAYYSGNSVNFFASGGGCNNTSGASVIAHEWGHGLDDQYGGLSQTNGLSEGWGDICSMYLLDDPTIGHDFFSGGGGIRTGNNNQQYPNGSEVHAMGESWMGFAWKFRQNLRTTLGNTQAIAISNDVVLGSIAANAANQADAVLAVFLADDDDALLANGTPHHTQLAAACQAHNLPYPPILAGYLLHTPLASTNAQATPRRIEADAIPVSGSYTQVRVHWNDGQSHQRNMIPTGTVNRWHALLPGQLAPQVVQYHIEAVHSTGPVHRLPASGEYQYATQAERRLFFENFEGSTAGWTHGIVSGVDDWEIGVPVAHAGNGWSDPAAAASGTRCAGTDLGITGDGAYSPACESWLRSPTIDCTGITGIRLRFKRWLSCAGPTDRVELRLSGGLVWLSSFTPVHESSWSVFDVSMPAANNNPSVTLEFRIHSAGTVQYGGWNIDDVELYSLNYAVPLPATLRLLPEQAQQGAPIVLTVNTSGPQPFLLVLGDGIGPLIVPGFPALQAGGNLIGLFGSTDAAGLYSTTFAAPGAPVVGSPWYSQVLTIDGNAVVTSNPFVNLFTQ